VERAPHDQLLPIVKSKAQGDGSFAIYFIMRIIYHENYLLLSLGVSDMRKLHDVMIMVAGFLLLWSSFPPPYCYFVATHTKSRCQ